MENGENNCGGILESQKNFAALGALGEYPIPPTPSDLVEPACSLHSVVVFHSSSSSDPGGGLSAIGYQLFAKHPFLE